MTLRLTHKRAKPRWLGLALVVGAALAVAVGATLAHSGINSIPSNFFVVTDQQGANDVPAQSDLTQMGRDDTDATQYKLFWSWDQTDQWTGTGQTGDACALFDNDGDTNINFVLCVRINNPGADPNTVAIVPLDATHPVYLFSCSDNKNDRCTNPSPVGYTGESQADAGKLGTLANSNLITDTDPFPAVGSNTPHDSTVEARILKSIIPGTEVLVNVCSYPSAGNGGNNNPFDCIVNPGGGFLVITKDAGAGVTSPTFGFTVNPGSVTRTIAGSGSATAIPLAVTTTASASETTIPSPWALQSTTCTLAGGGSTGTVSATGRTGITIQSGLITTCTFVDRIPTGTLTVIKSVVNDNGGTKVASDFTYNVGDGVNTNETAAASPGKSYTLQTGTTWNVVETAVAGYTTTYSAGCSGTMTSGGSFTCTITNNDQKASPGATTVMKWTLNDRLTLSSFRTGGTGGTATFSLYKDSATCSNTAVFTETVNVNNATGTAATTTGYTTEDAGTYRWVVTYTGNNFNETATSACGAEVTTLP